MTNQPEPDTCRPVEVDGELIRVRGSGEMSDETQAALAEVIRAARRRMINEQRAAMAKYPYQDGDVTVLGPEIFASSDGAVISWKGENYVRQPEPDFTSPIAGRVEVRDPCPHCEDCPLIPRALMAQHQQDHHPETVAADDLTGYWAPDPAIGCITATNAEPSDPTQCSGEEGFCPEHGFHRHSLEQPAEPEPAGLREQYAAAIRDTPAGYPDDVAAAVMRVHDREMQRLAELVEFRTEMFRESQRQAAEIEQHRDQLAALYERLVKAGPPPLGTSVSRWWDTRLAELHTALNPTKEQQT